MLAFPPSLAVEWAGPPKSAGESHAALDLYFAMSSCVVELRTDSPDAHQSLMPCLMSSVGLHSDLANQSLGEDPVLEIEDFDVMSALSWFRTSELRR